MARAGGETGGASSAPRWLPAGLALALAALVVVAFAPALRAEFVNWDDPSSLLTNPRLRGLTPENLGWMFSTSWLGPYQPLAWLSLTLDHELWGLSGPREFPEAPRWHLTSVLLHAAAAAAFLGFAARLLGRALPGAAAGVRWFGAALATVLFAVHPLRAESVAWVTERRDVLSGLFFALALWAWVAWAPAGTAGTVRRARLVVSAVASLVALLALLVTIDLSDPHSLALRGPGWIGLAAAGAALAVGGLAASLAESGAGGAARYLLALLLFALSLLSKGTGLTLPLALLVLDAWPLGRLGPRAGRLRRGVELTLEKAPWLALSVAIGTLAIWGQRAQETALVGWAEHTLGERLVQCLHGLAWYPWKTLVPTGLVPIVELPREVSLATPRFLVAVLAVAGLGVGLLALRRRAPAVIAALAAFALLVAPVLGLTQAGPQLVADRYSYLPGMPLAVLLGGSMALLAERRPGLRVAVLALGAAWTLALGVLTYQQARIWTSSKALWEHALASAPDSPAAHQFLALVRRDEVVDAPDPATKRALLYEARALLERGLELGGAPRFLEYLRDVELQLLGLEPERADEHAEAALAWSRRALAAAAARGGASFDARLAHAQLLVHLGRAGAAVGELEALARERPRRAGTWSALGAALLDLDRAAEARPALERAATLAPEQAGTWLLLGRSSEALGEREAAAAAYAEALRLAPGSVSAIEGLRRVGERTGPPR